ncbi:MAG TPA: helix-turn-helix domain-containing protein [Firmicutes bacterium]|nr:helix-turn-helix domain-containing protein [Bacillota bacterium]
MPEKLLLTVTEAAQMCGYSRSFLYEAINRGEIPTIRLGRTCRIPASWLRRWIEEQTARWERARNGEA